MSEGDDAGISHEEASTHKFTTPSLADAPLPLRRARARCISAGVRKSPKGDPFFRGRGTEALGGGVLKVPVTTPLDFRQNEKSQGCAGNRRKGTEMKCSNKNCTRLRKPGKSKCFRCLLASATWIAARRKSSKANSLADCRGASHRLERDNSTAAFELQRNRRS